MRKFTLLVFLFAIVAVGLQAQRAPLQNWQKMAQPYPNKNLTGFEYLDPSVPVTQNPFVSSRTDVEVNIGSTVYDLQSNNSGRSMLVRDENGNLAATWTMGMNAADGYSGRGAGYNYFDGNDWGPQPTQRVESERTGWSNIVMLEDGSQFIVAHTLNNSLLTAKNASGAWIESTIPTSVPGGLLWPRAVADGNTIHVICISAPSGLDGAVYEGLDGHLLYYRSTDGGTTWDITDQILPGMDNTKYTFTTADSYGVDANNGTVAVAIYSNLGDTQVSISSENGDVGSWETEVVLDFPVDAYAIDAGIDPAVFEPTDTFMNPDGSFGIFSSDNTGSVLVDNDGLVHAWFGDMAYSDDDLTDGGWTFFPGLFGVHYWNQLHGSDSTRIIASVIDANGDGVFNIADVLNDIGNYGTSMSSTPATGVDSEGNIFLVYSAVTEDDIYFNQNATPGPQHARHLYITASSDGGETWLDTPVDLIRPDIIFEPDLQPAVEAVYPAVARNVDGAKVDIIYQQDFEPGTAIGADADGPVSNFINYIGATYDEVGLIGDNTTAVNPETFNFQISPNPTSSFINIDYEIPSATSVSLTLSNMMGQSIRNQEMNDHPAGTFNTNMDLSNLPKGVYLLQLRADAKVATHKVVVE